MEDFVHRAEYEQFCKAVNGSLLRIENSINELSQSFTDQIEKEADRRREDVITAAAKTAAQVSEAVGNTMNRSYAIIITLLTAVAASGWGILITHILTKHH